MKKETEWISIVVEPKKKSCVLYQVAIITTSGKRKVATALCSYEKKEINFSGKFSIQKMTFIMGLFLRMQNFQDFQCNF